MKPLLTLFSAPKPFDREHIALIQRNAIRSWLALGEKVEVLLIGEEPGLAEVAAEMGVRHLPHIARNDRGTPLVSSIFALAREAAAAPYLGYINADIILLPDFLEAVESVLAQTQGDFLMVGRRWDLDVTTPLETTEGWAQRLRALAREKGRLHSPFGIDYFVFPKGAYAQMPPFAVGRAGWDNWMIYHARRKGWKVIDATEATTVIHQNHDYAHLPGGQPHYRLEESQENIRLAGGRSRMFSILEANYTLNHGQLHRLHRPLTQWLRQWELRLQRNGYPTNPLAQQALKLVRFLLHSQQ